MQKLYFIFISLTALCIISSASGQEVYTDNVVIVLDASGSMNGDIGNVIKMDAAKSALHQVLATVPETTHIGLLVFSAKNLRNDWVYPLGPRDDVKLKAAINLPQASGGTPLGNYIKKGADRLLQERQKQYGYGSYRLLVVTDGEASDASIMERNTRLVLQRGVISLDVIGVGMKQRHTLATMSHSYRKANDPESLTRAIKEVFAEVSADAAGGADAGAFEEIAFLTGPIASGILKSLATGGNHPIGVGPDEKTAAVSKVKNVSPNPQPISNQRRNPQPIPRDKGFGSSWMFILIVGIVVVSILVKSSGHKSRGRRHKY